METIIDMLFPASMIMTLFVVIWLIAYPREMWDSMMFRECHSMGDYILGIGGWVYLFGMVFFFTVLADKIK